MFVPTSEPLKLTYKCIWSFQNATRKSQLWFFLLNNLVLVHERSNRFGANFPSLRNYYLCFVQIMLYIIKLFILIDIVIRIPITKLPNISYFSSYRMVSRSHTQTSTFIVIQKKKNKQNAESTYLKIYGIIFYCHSFKHHAVKKKWSLSKKIKKVERKVKSCLQFMHY